MYKIFYVVTVGNAIELLAKRVLSCCLVIQEVRAGDTAVELQLRVHECEYEIYPLAIQWFADGRLSIDNGNALLDGCKSVQQYRRFRSASYIGQ